MDKFIQYLPAINIFCAAVMLAVMIQQFIKGDTFSAILSAIILVANLISYFSIEKKNESVH
jgi:hypothetical protein